MIQEAAKDIIRLREIIRLSDRLQEQRRLMKWDNNIAAAGMISLAIPYGEIGGVPLLLRVFGTAVVVVGGWGMAYKRNLQIANTEGQLEGVERQVRRGPSLQDPTV